MPNKNDLPKLESCMRLLYTVHDHYRTEWFTATQIDSNAFEVDTKRLLDLSVAYGFIEFDEPSYRLKIEPNAETDRWESALREHTDQLVESIQQIKSHDSTSRILTDELVHEEQTFASISVSESDDFESIIDSIQSLDSDRDGIVLRSTAEYANEVQRLADRLCTPSELTETPVSEQFQKELSDVVGNDKNDLEFRLFLVDA